MASERERLLELALESLLRRQKEIDAEIEMVSAQLKKPGKVQKARPAKAAKPRAHFSKEERLRRSKRMKQYWDNWRKGKKSATT